MKTGSPSRFVINYQRVKVGYGFLAPDKTGRELNCEPLTPLNINNFAFKWLQKKLHETRYSFKIHPTGNIIVVLPKTAKYGFILGWIAWTYIQTIRMEESE
jgi:hypothetical protein